MRDTSHAGNVFAAFHALCKLWPKELEVTAHIMVQKTLTMANIMTSFIPRTHPDIYLPAIFKIWEAFNSAILDERFMELAGDLARDHVAGPESEFGSDGTAAWKDVGIWTAEQWSVLTNKGLNMMGRLNYLNVSVSDFDPHHSRTSRFFEGVLIGYLYIVMFL